MTTATQTRPMSPKGISRPDYVYVASSWRNPIHEAFCEILKAADINHYNFKEPTSGAKGFHWTEVGMDPNTCRCDHSQGVVGICEEHGHARHSRLISARGGPDNCLCPRDGMVPQGEYLRGIAHPIAERGYASDFAAMERADAFVLVLPCGRSAHLELGWAVGAGKRTCIILEDPCVPELMYKMCDYLATSVIDCLGWLGVQD